MVTRGLRETGVEAAKCFFLESRLRPRFSVIALRWAGLNQVVTKVLALELASQAGIDAASARIVQIDDVPVAVIRRFDRDDADGRIPYQSAASLLQVSREEGRSYTEIADAIRANGHAQVRVRSGEEAIGP